MEEEGLAAFIDGAQQAGFTGVLDVHVRVAQRDVEQARRVIEEMRRPAVSEEAWNEATGEATEATEGMDDNAASPDPTPDEKRCPACGTQMAPGFANAIGLTGPTPAEPRIVFVVPGDKTSVNPLRAFQQGLNDESQGNAYALRGWRCEKCGRVEFIAREPVVWPPH